jgi:phospho-N-acetylmuramoyl-pentapeptide-transferase
MMIAELVPVPLQILSVKLFKRKLFPFTPIHHAFEKAGWKETRVVWSFALVQLLLTVAALTFAAIAFNPSMAPTP